MEGLSWEQRRQKKNPNSSIMSLKTMTRCIVREGLVVLVDTSRQLSRCSMTHLMTLPSAKEHSFSGAPADPPIAPTVLHRRLSLHQRKKPGSRSGSTAGI